MHISGENKAGAKPRKQQICYTIMKFKCRLVSKLVAGFSCRNNNPAVVRYKGIHLAQHPQKRVAGNQAGKYWPGVSQYLKYAGHAVGYFAVFKVYQGYFVYGSLPVDKRTSVHIGLISCAAICVEHAGFYESSCICPAHRAFAVEQYHVVF